VCLNGDFLKQNPELPSDLTNFSKNDFNILKNTLQQCIPFIRFYNLTSNDFNILKHMLQQCIPFIRFYNLISIEFSDKVLPYKKILPKKLYMDLLKTFLNLHPSSRPNGKSKPRNNTTIIDSEIIAIQHVELISKWIDKVDITDDSDSSYGFKLMLRGSRDGFSVSKFHEICDSQPRTVTIVKVKDSDKILGGYNPIEWNSSGGFNSTRDSFIFSFENSDSIENYVLSRVVNENRDIWNSYDYGLCFGDSDLVLYGNNFL
jgi:hypothetical protein